jgi:alpha-beta hydrolase superfamily lysophospholipase
MRHLTPAPPTAVDAVDGLAYSLWLPRGEPEGGVVVVHGADSQKESHHDFARLCRDSGLAAVCFDLRGHGASPGPLDARVLADVATIAGVLPPGLPLALRGSSLGGYLAIAAAELAGAAAVVAICPASGDMLARGLRSGRFGFEADVPALEALLSEHDLRDAVARSAIPLMLLHAEGDERVPVAGSIELDRLSAARRKKLIVVPGGHHRSVQHDAELQAEAVRFIRKAFRGQTPSFSS